MFLLLDECCGKALARRAEALGHTAQRSVEVSILGRGASDPEVFDFAFKSGAVVITVNRGDFLALAGLQPGHPGVFILPSLPNRVLLPLFDTLLRTAEPLVTATAGLVVELDANSSISSYPLP